MNKIQIKEIKKNRSLQINTKLNYFIHTNFTFRINCIKNILCYRIFKLLKHFIAEIITFPSI